MKKSEMNRLERATAVAAFALLLALASCETTKGAGRDIEDAGGAVEDFAEDVEDSMDD